MTNISLSVNYEKKDTSLNNPTTSLRKIDWGYMYLIQFYSVPMVR